MPRAVLRHVAAVHVHQGARVLRGAKKAERRKKKVQKIFLIAVKLRQKFVHQIVNKSQAEL